MIFHIFQLSFSMNKTKKRVPISNKNYSYTAELFIKEMIETMKKIDSLNIILDLLHNRITVDIKI